MFNFRKVASIVGIILLFIAAMMALPLFVSLYFSDGDSSAIGWSMIITCISGLALFLQGRKQQDIGLREGFAVVTFGWCGMALSGALPFYISGAIPSFTDCLFESMSGFSATGASILGAELTIESLPHGILFWRSLTHWIGGMGIILLSLAILPLLGVGGMQLYRAEFPGPVKDKLTPRIKNTAEILWFVYVIISGVEFILLYIGGMSMFDAACHTFGTMATGGFSTYSGSIGTFESRYIHYVVIVFMIIAGTNFTLHYHLLKRKPRYYWKSTEFRMYVGLIGGFSAAMIIINLAHGQFGDFEETFRLSVFHVASIMTTTGFGAADWEAWGGAIQVMMVMMMIIGGMAGSTGGGVKVVRIQILFSQIRNELKRLIHPHAIIPLRLGGRLIDESIVGNVLAFLLAFCFIMILSTAILSVMGIDIVTSFGATIACLSNIGPGLAGVGPSDNYGHLPQMAKWLLVGLMMLGRLEVFTVLVLFSKHFWKR